MHALICNITSFPSSVQSMGWWEKKFHAAEKQRALHLTRKWKFDYSDMVGFVRAPMAIVIMISNTTLMKGQ